MARSTSARLRRRRIAGAATAGLLSLGLLTACGSGSSDAGSSDAEAKPRSSATEKVETKDILAGDALTSRNFAFNMDGRDVEYLAEVSDLRTEADEQTTQQSQNGQAARRLIPGAGAGGEAVIVRGQTKSEELTRFAAGETTPETVSLVVLDYQNNPVKRYEMANPRVTRIDQSPAGADGTSTEALTISFSQLTVH
ncbi:MULTISPECIES: phage tail protein [Streptomyces]|uniref:Phage tail protein n=1 Tax=Streptomyces lienomycini TaxID=284035 RepID=A0ABV9WUG1_9ACTN|nr:phage tail protein [Streptomyces lienomycini]